MAPSLACPRCGAALPGAAPGATVTCAGCGAASRINADGDPVAAGSGPRAVVAMLTLVFVAVSFAVVLGYVVVGIQPARVDPPPEAPQVVPHPDPIPLPPPAEPQP